MNRTWIARDDRGVSPVIATILMVAITVVLAAVLYLMVTNWTRADTNDTTKVTFGPAEVSGNVTTIQVAGVSASNNLEDYSVIVLVNDSTGLTYKPLAGGRYQYVEFLDINANGKLDSGDRFKVYCTFETDYELILYEGSGKVVSITWTT